MVKKEILMFLNGAKEDLIRYGVRHWRGSRDAEHNEKLAEKYGEIAEKMRQGTEEGSTSGSSDVNPAKVYRRRLQGDDEVCGICIEMLKRLEKKSLDVQVSALPTVAEAVGASRSGGSVEDLKEIMENDNVLRDILLEMKEGQS